MLLAGVFLTGCSGGDKSASTSSSTAADTNKSSGNPITAPVDYLGAVAKAQKTANKTVATAGVTQAIRMFEAQEGRLPKTLNELVPNYVDRIPPAPAGMKYAYNPADGSVKIVPQ